MGLSIMNYNLFLTKRKAQNESRQCINRAKLNFMVWHFTINSLFCLRVYHANNSNKELYNI
jgi:hypothetical protein